MPHPHASAHKPRSPLNRILHAPIELAPPTTTDIPIFLPKCWPGRGLSLPIVFSPFAARDTARPGFLLVELNAFSHEHARNTIAQRRGKRRGGRPASSFADRRWKCSLLAAQKVSEESSMYGARKKLPCALLTFCILLLLLWSKWCMDAVGALPTTLFRRDLLLVLAS